jgi:cation diffusion facilitator CzcD-associated flavoprotein CzcO
MRSSSVDVAIVGAGPYGLSLATHLSARRVEHRIFGMPMETWSKMPPGMCLKSLGFATNIFTPDGQPTLPDYCRERGLESYEPIEISTFEQYGRAVQKSRVSYLEEVGVDGLRRLNNDHYELQLDTDETVRARRVVIGVGLRYFAHLPPPLDALPAEVVSHTANRSDYSDLSGRDVAVVGRGQSALEAAALLHEQGARVQVLTRHPIGWGARGRPDAERSLWERVRVPTTMLGGGRDNWVLQHVPTLMHYAPTKRRLEFTRTHLGPAGAWWLRDRVDGRFPVHTATSIRAAECVNGRVRITMDDGDPRDILTDYVVAGTGYRVDVDRITFIDRDLARGIRKLERSPKLSRHFECNVPNLYFMGLASAASFGPFFRFVAGSSYTAPALARRLAA